MIETFFSIFSVFFNILKYPIYVILFFIAVFLFSCFVNVFILLIQGKKFPKRVGKRIKNKSILWRIFVDTPKQYVSDFFAREPDYFPYQGLIIFEGRQGAGKTISMVHFLNKIGIEYPCSKCITNFGYLKEDNALKDWRMLVHYKNGSKGVVVAMDELQNWFSSNDSRNFPPEMLSVITQNRKNRRVILGTSQNFYLLAKAIRSQCTEVRRCTSVLGCLTFVRRFEPYLDSEGNVKEWKKRGMYFFVHNKDLRSSYDTYKVIENLSKSGFIEKAPEISQNYNVFLNNKK